MQLISLGDTEPTPIYLGPGQYNLFIASSAWAGRTIGITVSRSPEGPWLPLEGNDAYTADSGAENIFGGKWFSLESDGDFEDLDVSFSRSAG